MKKLLKIFALTAAAGLVLFLTAGVVIAATVVRSGMVMVQVEEKSPDGVSFSAPVPVGLLTFGAGMTRFIDDTDLAEARHELETVRPLLHDLTTELLDAPSFTMVEVHHGEDHVLIYKQGRSLIIDVDNPEARVHLSFPVNLAERVINSILG